MTTRRLPRPFTRDELRALYRTARPDVVATMRFLHETGLRSAEALSITTAEARTWARPGRLRQRSQAIRIVGKGDKERVVLLTNTALRAARTLLRGGYSNGHLIPWSGRGLRYVVSQAGQRAGVAHAHPHRFRHTFCSEHAEAGTDIAIVADLAGHSSVNTTRLYYESSINLRRQAERRRRRLRGL